MMLRVLAILGAILLTLIGLFMLLLMLNASGLPICDELGGDNLADECIEASSAERTIGLVAGWLAVAGSFLAVALAVRYALRRAGGGVLVTVALAAPTLALVSIGFLPISF